MNGRIRRHFTDECTRPALLAGLVALLLAANAAAQEAQWIWSPENSKESVPAGEACHFRKAFSLHAPEEGRISIAADDQYELYLNGRRVGTGEATKKLDEYDVSRFLSRGVNVVSVKVTNRTGNTAALAARVSIKDGGAWTAHSSDATWRTALRPLPLWNTTLYNDRTWAEAQSFGVLGGTAPWDRRENVPVEEVSKSERFTIDPQFEVQQVLPGDSTGSLIAM